MKWYIYSIIVCILIAGLIPVYVVSATDDEETYREGIKIAEAWLDLVDGEKYEESWNEAGTLFKNSVTSEIWVEQAASVRTQIGDLVERNVEGVGKDTDPPGAPPGTYMTVGYISEFSIAGSAAERIILTEDGERGWRVVGYFVQPPPEE